MQMSLLSSELWLAHFLLAFYFNTLPANSAYTETTPTLANQDPNILPTATNLSPLTTTTQDITTDITTEVNTQLNISPNVTFTSLHQYNSSRSQNDVMGDGVSISNANDVAVSHTDKLNSHTTVSTNFARIMSNEDNRNETGTTSSPSNNQDGHTVQTPDPLNSVSTASWKTWTNLDDETTKADEGNYETNSTQDTFANMNIARQTPQINDKNETGTMSSQNYNQDGHTVQTPDPLNSVSTAPWKTWTNLEEETTNAEGNYETNSTQDTFANMNISIKTPQIDDKNETGTVSSTNYIEDRETVQTPDPFNSASTAPWKTWTEDETTKAQGNYETNSTQDTFANMNISIQTPQIDDKNETGTVSSTNYIEDRETVQTPDPFNSDSTAPWKTWTEDEITKAEENYETNSTQDTFANTNKEWTGTQGTKRSYDVTNEHKEEHYETTVTTFNITAATATEKNDWSTSQSTDIPMATPTSTISQDPTVTDEPEYHTSTDGGKTENENITGTDTPSGTTYTTNKNNSITTNILTVNITNTTTEKTNKTDTESKGWPTCGSSESRRPMLACIITLWSLAMTATIFLGISIFLWVRLSAFKKKMKQREKKGHAGNKESLWADPKASVQERVEFWYVNGSTLEADRKQKDRKRQERVKRRGYEQENEERELWLQPRVTVDDITEFWYANRWRNERTTDV